MWCMLYFVGNIAFVEIWFKESCKLASILNYYARGLRSSSRQQNSLEGQAPLDEICRDKVFGWIAMSSLTDKVWV